MPTSQKGPLGRAVAFPSTAFFMKFVLGTKQQMTQVFDNKGRVYPATILSVSPLTVTQVKTADTKDGYAAVQVGTGVQKEKNINKAQRAKGTHRTLKEFRVADAGGLEMGATIDASVFSEGDVVEVSAISKGKGFQGVVKRHGFAGGRRTHGQKHSEREPGSIGAGGVQRVFKGLRMAGRMGGDRVTVKNLKVLQVNSTDGTLVISGAIPGRRGTLVEVRGK